MSSGTVTVTATNDGNVSTQTFSFEPAPAVPGQVVIEAPATIDALYNLAGSRLLTARDDFGGALVDPT